MDVTLANIRREVNLERALWAQVIGLAASGLVGLESGRQALRHGAGWPLAVVLGGVLVGLGAVVSIRLARRVRAVSRETELWRKFGLDSGLLHACAALGPLDEELGQQLDRALRDLRSLAAVGNHAAWDEPDTPDPGDVVEVAERVLRRAVEGDLADRLPPLAEVLAEAKEGQRLALAALLHDDPASLAPAWTAFEAAAERLREWADG